MATRGRGLFPLYIYIENLKPLHTNARTGTGQDYIDKDDKHIPIPSGKRQSQILLVCPHRKELFDICIEANLYILNGKAFGDGFGKYTLFQYNVNRVWQIIVLFQRV